MKDDINNQTTTEYNWERQNDQLNAKMFYSYTNKQKDTVSTDGPPIDNKSILYVEK